MTKDEARKRLMEDLGMTEVDAMHIVHSDGVFGVGWYGWDSEYPSDGVAFVEEPANV